MTKVAPPKENLSLDVIAYDDAIKKGCTNRGWLKCYSVNPELFHHMEGKSKGWRTFMDDEDFIPKALVNGARTEERFRTRKAFSDTYTRVVTEAIPFLDKWLEDGGAGPWVTAPIIDHERSEDFLMSLEKSECTRKLKKPCIVVRSAHQTRVRPKL